VKLWTVGEEWRVEKKGFQVCVDFSLRFKSALSVEHEMNAGQRERERERENSELREQGIARIAE